MYDYNCGFSPAGSLNGAPFGVYSDADLDMDFTTSSYPGMATGSVFGDGFSMMPMAGGYGGGFDMQSMYNNMQQQQQFQTDYSIKQQQLNRNADLQVNAPMEAIKGAATALKDKITSNEQDQIRDAYERYVNAVAAAYGTTPDDSVIKARANSLYANMNNGVTLVQDLRQYGHGSMTQGLIQGMTFGLYDKRSAEDNISTITGSPVGTTEKTKHNLGRLAGAATLGGIAGGIAKACKSGKAGKIGLIVAGIATAISFITGKVTT